MLHRPQFARLIRASGFLFCLAAYLCCASLTYAYTPDSPEVIRMVDRGLEFLNDRTHAQLGGKCLLGMTYHIALERSEDGPPIDHPQIVAAVEACLKTVDESSSIGLDYPQHEIYNTGIALIFLCELDPEKYRPEIEHFVRSLEKWQRSYGAWGYPRNHLHDKTGDTSMTQYAVLGLWAAHELGGVDVNVDAATRACGWLLRTQDPSGAWGYQGRDPGTFKERVQQQKIRHSMAAAGLSSIYVLAHLLNLLPSSEIKTDSDQPVSDKSVDVVKREGPLTRTISSDLLRNGMRAGEAWFAENMRYEGTQFTHYYMYALERYYTFYEWVTGNEGKKEPRWYNEGVRFLADTQRENGQWNSAGATGPVVDTAYAILFLKRGTKRLLPHEDKGVLIASRGLPKNTANFRIENNRVVADEEPGPAEAIIRRLENEGAEEVDWASVDQFANMRLSEDAVERVTQIESLERILRAGTGPARLIAVRVLAKNRDLDQVPALIYALSSVDPFIRQEARKGLRFVSRKVQGFELPDDPEPGQIQSAIAGWKRWYSSIEPEAEFWE